MSDVFATYHLGNATSREQAEKFAEQIAYGQTLGMKPPANELELYRPFLAEAVEVNCDEHGQFSTKIRFPATLFAHDLAGMLTVLFGKISFMPGIRLADLAFADDWLQGVKGARFGLAGLRVQSKTTEGPLLMAILKPGIGPDLNLLASQVSQLAEGGFQLVKDDEICIDASEASALARVKKLSAAAGDEIIYVTHLTGAADKIFDHALRLQDAGARALLFCPYTYGLSILQALTQHPSLQLPVFVHPAMTGIMMQGQNGIASPLLLGLLPRLCGADAVLYPSPYGSIALPKEEAKALHKQLIRPLGACKAVASVPSAGITLDDIPRILEDFGGDVVINAGTGVAKASADQNLVTGAFAFVDRLQSEMKGQRPC